MSGAGFGFSGFSNINGVGFERFSNEMSFGFSNHNVNNSILHQPTPPSSLPRFSFTAQEKSNSSLPRFSFTAQEKSMSSSDEDEKTPSPKKRKRKKLEWLPLTSEAEFCPAAIIEYINTPLSKRRKFAELNLRVKKHLLYIGWKINFVQSQNGSRVCYLSPDGKTYMSLTQVCSELKDSLPAIDPPLMVKPRECKKLADSEQCSQAVVDYISLCHASKSSDSKEKTEAKVNAKKHLVCSGWEFYHAVKKNKKELRYQAPNGKVFYSLLTACKWFAEANSLSPGDHLPKESEFRGVTESATDNTVQNQELPRKSLQLRANVEVLGKFSSIAAQDVKDSDQSRVLRSSRQEALSSSTKRNILSCLIDNNVVLPQAKVQYRKKDGSALKDGKITRDGIQCNCCQQVYGLSNFEAHAKSTYHRPSAYIFLEDGRSLLDCQMDMKRKSNVTKSQKSPQLFIKHDDICSVCLDFGELLLCDLCPSAFHASCLGLKEFPPGDWFCPSCCCGICHKSQFDRNKNQITDNAALCCYQCEHQYHVGCLKSNCLLKLDYFPEGKWFCNYRCEQIFLGLRRILGKPVAVGSNNLTWTLLKSTKQNDSYHSKLSVALGVMHECFTPLKESRTKRDLMEDVIFSQWSELNRLNFQGFYTAILERNDEVVTVATLRVYGEKVAEIPLVATLFKHRRLGMCRVLMNQLEKKLAELGVQRLVLPALPDAVNTWTGSFGFSVMTKAERQNFLDNTFLNFNGTIMCQKLLPSQKDMNGNIPAVSEASRPVCAEELDGNSPASEVFQPEEFDFSVLFDQEPEDFINGFAAARGDN